MKTDAVHHHRSDDTCRWPPGHLKFKVRTTPRTFPLQTGCERALYTISLGAFGKPLNHVVNGYQWARHFFSDCRILVGDGLFRITIQITEGLCETAARVRANTAAKDVLATFQHSLGPAVKLDFRSSVITDTLEFAAALFTVQTIENEHKRFADSLFADAERFVDRQARCGRLHIERHRAIALARQYVQQEVAIYLYLAKQGWFIDVYLGRELPTLEKIITEELHGVHDELKRRVSICLSQQ